MLSQKEAVFKSTLEVLEEANLVGEFNTGKPISDVLNKDLRKLVVDKLVALIKTSQVSFRSTVSNKNTLTSDKLVKTYASGLVSNHWKRDKRLNGKSSLND